MTKGLGARGFDVRRVSTGGDAQTVATDDVAGDGEAEADAALRARLPAPAGR